jgi:hypothetical protein
VAVLKDVVEFGSEFITPGLFFWGKFFITAIDLFNWFISSWFNFGSQMYLEIYPFVLRIWVMHILYKNEDRTFKLVESS